VTLQDSNIIRLFFHELHRVFADRLCDPNDEKWFFSASYDIVVANFCTTQKEEETQFFDLPENNTSETTMA
jgi:hypothetical protein